MPTRVVFKDDQEQKERSRQRASSHEEEEYEEESAKHRPVSKRTLSRKYIEGQQLSAETILYYKKMNEALAGAAARAMDENNDLNARIADLEEKLVQVAGLIQEREAKKRQAEAEREEMLARLKEEEELRRRLEEEDRARREEEEERRRFQAQQEEKERAQQEREQTLIDQYEQARQELEELLLKNESLKGEHDQLKDQLHFIEQEQARRLRDRSEVEVQVVAVTAELSMETTPQYFREAEVNTELHTKEATTDTLGLISITSRDMLTDPPKPHEDIERAIIFPMMR